MKTYWIILVTTFGLLACNNKVEQSIPSTYKESTIKNEVLIQSVAEINFSKPNNADEITLTVSGSSIVNGIATLKAIDLHGEEVYCESFSAKKLIQEEYKTAPIESQESHIRDVVEGYFVDAKESKSNDNLLFVSS